MTDIAFKLSLQFQIYYDSKRIVYLKLLQLLKTLPSIPVDTSGLKMVFGRL